jgi:hypothetical protein
MKSIMDRVTEHYEEALEHFSADQIVGCFLQGSQNYGLDLPGSDVDTKLIVVPTFKDVALNRKPVSTTHIRANEEHIDFKDIRLYMETFRKQNLNFLEILFTPFTMINSMYFDQWDRLIEERESIARMNPWRAVKSMKGIALEKYHAMEHRYPSKVDLIDAWGYDGKQLSHLIRVEEYLTRYIAGEAYADCLITKKPELLIATKDMTNPKFTLEQARTIAGLQLGAVTHAADRFAEEHKDDPVDWRVDVLLDDVQRDIVKLGIELELEKG